MQTTLHFAKIEMDGKQIFLEMTDDREIKMLTLAEVFDKIAKMTKAEMAHTVLHNVITDNQKMIEFMIKK